MKENDVNKENEKLNKEKNIEKDKKDKENKEPSPSKELSQFISIIEQTSASLPNILNSIKKYFVYIETKISNLTNQMNHTNNINREINSINKIKENFLPKEVIFSSLEKNNQLFKYNELFDNYEKFLEEKNKIIINFIDESIINEIRKQMEKVKVEKNKIFYKFQNLINDVTKLKNNIDLIENKDNEEFKIDNNSNDLQILQNYLFEFEKEYHLILSQIKKLNENILFFISDNIYKYFEIKNKINEEILKERTKIMNDIKQYKINEDNFLLETIQKMDDNLEKRIKKFISLKNEYNSETKKTLLSNLGDALMLEAREYFILMNNYHDEFENDLKLKYNNNDFNKDDLAILKDVINKLKKSDVVSDDLLNSAFGILGNNSNRYQYINLCLNFVKYVNSNSSINKDNNNDNFKYENFDNFIFSNNLFNMISHNCKNNFIIKDKKEDFKENYKYYQILNNIIDIGNKSFIENKYMSSLLKDSQFINDVKIWVFCYKCELISNIKKYLNKKDTNINNIQNVINLLKNKTNLSSYNNFDFIKNLELNQYIENYDKLNNNEKNNFNNYELPKIVHNSVKKYLFYMANYNVVYIDVLNFIKEINEDFPFIKDEYWSFYLDYYKSSLYSIKKQIFESNVPNIKIKKKIKCIKNKEDYKNEEQNNIINGFKSEERKKIIFILKNTMNFLNNIEKSKLLCLNKKINIFKYIYKSFLEVKHLSIQKHINIWKTILGCSKIKNINYLELCKNAEKAEYYKVIIDDTKRTTLKSKGKEESNEIIKNILCCFSLKNSSKINYCQGMNFLAAFLYDLTNNEEETFLLFTCLIDNTELAKIYDHKFELLNAYFYVLERLIFLFLPRISKKFREVQINMDCFASAYFITLFSNVYILSNSANKFIMFIIDNFIIKGWRVIFKTILTLLKYNEKEIIDKKDDEIVNYVIHEMKKSDVFLEENFDKFFEIFKNLNIKDDLIKNLEEEYNLEKKIKSDLNINMQK